MVDKIKREKTSYKRQIEIAKAMRRLQANPDYLFVFEEVFFVEECARNARISGLITQDPEVRQDALMKAQAAGHLAEWISARIKLGMNAEESLRILEETEHEIISESQGRGA